MKRALAALLFICSWNTNARADDMLERTAKPTFIRGENPKLISLRDGRAVLLGGKSTIDGSSGSEAFDPVTKKWSLIAPMKQPRFAPSVTLLADGRLLVAGGNDGSGGVSLAETYDPATNAWTEAGTVSQWSHGPLAALGDGRAVLLVNPGVGTEPLHFWLFDNKTNSWSRGPSPATWRQAPQVAFWPLPDGDVLLAPDTGEVERYSPSTGWTSFPAPWPQSAWPAAIVLRDGRLLIAGGMSWDHMFKPPQPKGSEPVLFDLTTKKVSAIAGATRGSHTLAALLSDDRVLVLGGGFAFDGVAPIEVFDPTTSKMHLIGSQPPSWRGLLLTPITNGQALVIAGETGEAYVVTPPKFCGAAADCASGHCVDGVCCNTACAGQCEACDLPNLHGLCSPVVGDPHGARNRCTTTSDAVCAAQHCDGKTIESCTYAKGRETVCDSICGGSVVRHCDGAGRCGLPEESTCPDESCAISTTEPMRPRVIDAMWVIIAAALVHRARRR